MQNNEENKHTKLKKAIAISLKQTLKVEIIFG